MKLFDETFRTIFTLKSTLEHVLFKEFLQTYNLPKGINHTHMQTLMSLKFNGPTPMSDVSHMLTLEKGSFTPVANKLIKLKLITKERSLTDKRVYNLALSNEGELLATDFGLRHKEYVNNLFNSLDKNQKELVFESVDILNTTLLNLAKNSPALSQSCHAKNK